MTAPAALALSANEQESAIGHTFGSVAASQTDQILVSATSGVQIIVLRMVLTNSGTASTITLNSKGSGAGTAISQAFNLAANGNLDLTPPFADAFSLFSTQGGQGLSASTGSGGTVGYDIWYMSVGTPDE